MMRANSPEVSPSLESQLASELKALLAGKPVGSEFIVDPSDSFCYSLELFIPKALSRKYSEWTAESLDAIFVARARKTGPAAAQFAGTCILISDQTVTPVLIDLRLSPPLDRLEFFKLCLGEPGGGPLGISGPDCNSSDAKKLLSTIGSRFPSVAWSYSVASDAP